MRSFTDGGSRIIYLPDAFEEVDYPMPIQGCNDLTVQQGTQFYTFQEKP